MSGLLPARSVLTSSSDTWMRVTSVLTSATENSRVAGDTMSPASTVFSVMTPEIGAVTRA